LKKKLEVKNKDSMEIIKNKGKSTFGKDSLTQKLPCIVYQIGH
jgi:hypothetical protein